MRAFSSVGGFLLVCGLAFGAGYWVGRGSAPDDAEIAATERSIEALDLELAFLRPRYEDSRAALAATVDTEWVPARAIIERYRDSLFVPVPLVIGLAQSGDRVVSACSRATADCTDLVATEKARGDSLEIARDQWKARARGPLVAFGVAGMLDGGGLLGRADAQVRLSDQWRGMAEIEQRADSGGRVWRLGVRYAF